MLIDQTKEPRVNTICRSYIGIFVTKMFLMMHYQHGSILIFWCFRPRRRILNIQMHMGYDRPPSSPTGCRWTRSTYAYLNAPALSMDEMGGSKHAITYVPQERCTMFFSSTPCQPYSTAFAIFQVFMPRISWDIGKSGNTDVIHASVLWVAYAAPHCFSFGIVYLPVLLTKPSNKYR